MPEINIPFPGFYESWLDHGLDRAVELAAEHLAEEHGADEQKVREIIFDNVEWAKAHDILARQYAEHYNNWICDEYGLQLGLDFVQMTSPREYNFTTDQIFCRISGEAVANLWDAVDLGVFTEVCEQRHTSCSGFHSFYDPDWHTWGSILSWDYHQLGSLIRALHDDKDDLDWVLEERLSEDIDRALDEAVDWQKVEGEIQDHLLIEAGELVPDAREFPYGVDDTGEYVKQFDEMNHLKG